MKKIIILYALVPLLFMACHSPSTPKVTKNSEPVREVFRPIEENPALPNVLLIGDSISMGYTLPVREKLQGIANVHRIPTNGGPTTRGIDNIEQWLGNKDWDVIHFNWGLHDIKYMDDGEKQVSLRDYQTNLENLVQRLKQTQATLIWASTTPVPPVAFKQLSPKRDNRDVMVYNQAAKRIMKKHNVMINDLYLFALPRLDEIQRPANVHFTPSGSEQLAQQVAESIQKSLQNKN